MWIKYLKLVWDAFCSSKRFVRLLRLLRMLWECGGFGRGYAAIAADIAATIAIGVNGAFFCGYCVYCRLSTAGTLEVGWGGGSGLSG